MYTPSAQIDIDAVRFRVTCPHCTGKMLVRPAYSGEQISCPRCDGLVRVPYPVAQTAPPGETAISADPVDDSWQWQRVARPRAIPQPRRWR